MSNLPSLHFDDVGTTEQNVQGDNKYRTAKTARTDDEVQRIAEIPAMLSLITDPYYINALKYNTDNGGAPENAYLLQIRDDVEVKIDRGMAYIYEMLTNETSFVDYSTMQKIEELDVGLLASIYSVLLYNLKDEIKEVESLDDLRNNLDTYALDIYIPDFLAFMGLGRNINLDQEQAVMNKLNRFKSTVGVIEKHMRGKVYQDAYALLLFHNAKSTTNTMRISSPYMNTIIYSLLSREIKKNLQGQVIVDKKGKPKTLPVYSYIDGSIISVKNKRAYEIVTVIVALIEQTGNAGIPHKKVSEIIEDCPNLKASLEEIQSDSNKTQMLRRCFSTAYEYLDKYTDLKERYKNIQFPTETPTINNYKRMTLEFPHDGKTTRKGHVNINVP